MSLALIWAEARGGVIGANGTMPWHVPEDLAHFRRTTGSAPVIMGRKTWDSLPERFRPLPGRRNIVVTRQDAWQADGAERAASLEEAISLVAGEDAWVMGGAEIYRAALPHADLAVVTELDIRVDGDAHAPVLASWTARRTGEWAESASGIRYRFVEYIPGRE